MPTLSYYFLSLIISVLQNNLCFYSTMYCIVQYKAYIFVLL